jgi:hypothetical protein
MEWMRLALALMLAFPALGWAQERPAAEEVFHWFPDGTYKTLAFADMQSLRSTSSYALFSRAFEDPAKNLMGSGNPLPEGVKGSVIWLAFGDQVAMLNTFVPLENLTEEERLAATMGEGEGLTVDDLGRTVVRRQVDEGAMIWAFAFDDTVGIVRRGLSEGWLAKTGTLINHRQVFSMNNVEGNERKSCFAYATPTNELLVASELLALQRMIRTGSGSDLGLLDNPDYADLITQIRELGQSWTVSPRGLQDRAVLEHLQNNSGSPELISEMKESLENDPLFEILTYEFGDLITESTILIFQNKEAAEREAKNLAAEAEADKWNLSGDLAEIRADTQRSGLQERQREMALRAADRVAVLSESYTISVDGNIVTRKTTAEPRDMDALRYITELIFGKLWK